MNTTAISRTRPFFVSYGMGAESTAWLHAVLTMDIARPAEVEPDFSNLVVGTAQTGDEWRFTGYLVESHILPLLRAKNIRFVEVARRGPAKSDGITVLQDTTQPYKLHLDGDYKLSKENRDSGTLPILSGHHTCAQKSKGEPLDSWRHNTFGQTPYFHMIGYNVFEENRIGKDAGYSMGGRRSAVYPLHQWRWSREDCVNHLLHELGVLWPKSCCRQCPYINLASWPDQLANFMQHPEEAYPHLVDEFVTLALNPRSGLYGPGVSLTSRLRTHGATHVVDLAEAYMEQVPWALYRIRRRYNAPAIAPRSVEKVMISTRVDIETALEEIADRAEMLLSCGELIKGAPASGDLDRHRRLWVQRRNEGQYPSLEEFHVAAPAQVHDKALSTFEDNWAAIRSAMLLDKEIAVGHAIAATAYVRNDRRARNIFGVPEVQ